MAQKRKCANNKHALVRYTRPRLALHFIRACRPRRKGGVYSATNYPVKKPPVWAVIFYFAFTGATIMDFVRSSGLDFDSNVPRSPIISIMCANNSGTASRP